MKKINFYKNKFIKKYEVDLWEYLISYSNEDKFFKNIFLLFCFRKKFKYWILRFYFRKKRAKNFKYSKNIFKNIFKSPYKKYYLWRLHTLMKFRIYYGNFNLKKFRTYLKRALKRNIDFKSSLLLLLECRLDIILYRINLFKTPKEAKYFIKKGIIFVNGKKILNYKQQIYLNDVIIINNLKLFTIFLENLKRKKIILNFPRYLEINYKILKCILIFYPKQKDLLLTFKKDINILRTFF